MMSAPAGWHPQPDGRDRYWDGAAWTDNFRVGPTPLPAVGPQQAGKGFYRHWMGYVGAGLLGLFLGVGIGAAGGSPEEAVPAAAPTVTQTQQSTVTATATATVTPTPTEEPASAEQPSASATPEVFKMPNVVGENLQLAQDKLQKLGSYVLDQQDAAGLDRIQVVDANWQVCSQKPEPGKTVSADTVVVLASVKLTEDCP